MQYTEGKPGRVFIVRVDHGENLIETLLQFVTDHQVHGGYIRFMGALESGQVVTGPEVLTLPPDQHFESFSGGWEVIGMATITPDKNGPHLHVHASVGRGNKVLTGCLRGEIITYIVIEAVITELIGVDVQRVQDPVTGMQLPGTKTRELGKRRPIHFNRNKFPSCSSSGSGQIPATMTPAQPRFLPMTVKEGAKLGIGQFDVILVTGDSYVDHPSFGTALIGRVQWDAGFSVGVIAQPDWKGPEDFVKLGKPRLFFGISSGNVDSMVNNYTPARKVRNDDVYSPGGKGMRRPDRATTVYADRLHALFPGTPLVIGGIEASLRRFAHYDYWSDSVRHAILADAPADLLVFGMAEMQVTAIAQALSRGEPVGTLRSIPGTCYRMPLLEWRGSDHEGYIVLPPFSEVSTDKQAYARAFALHYREQDPFRGRPVVQVHPKTVIVQNPPARPMTTEELDHIYELPYSRKQHPSYREPVPSLEPVRFSVTSHRGCFGGCSFCALTHHQGRIGQSRSADSIVREVEAITRIPGFSGTIQDVGGPTANMYGASCVSWNRSGACSDRNCTTCTNLATAHDLQVALLRRLRGLPGVKRVFISSGIRYDLFDTDPDGYLEEIVTSHTSGHLKVAPEHIVRHITELMNKPGKGAFEHFCQKFEALGKVTGKEQYILPYFMSGHPGCRMEDMIALALYLRDHSLYTEQVQDFTPTPMSISTCMYYTGLDPFTQKPLYVPKGREKQVQRAMLHYRDREKQALVREGLTMTGRTDLIGPGKQCLVAPAYRASPGNRDLHKGPGSLSGNTVTPGRNTAPDPAAGRKKKR